MEFIGVRRRGSFLCQVLVGILLSQVLLGLSRSTEPDILDEQAGKAAPKAISRLQSTTSEANTTRKNISSVLAARRGLSKVRCMSLAFLRALLVKVRPFFFARKRDKPVLLSPVAICNSLKTRSKTV